MSNGVRLGWLIDPYQELVWIYRADGSVEQLDRPEALSGEDVCVGLSNRHDASLGKPTKRVR